MAINPIAGGQVTAHETSRSEPGGEHFASSLARFMRDVNQDQINAAKQIKGLVIDGEGSIHEAMSAMNKAEGSFRLLIEMRNRLVDGLNRLLQTRG